ncbi:protein-disulfide reductase DsbD domain-containing protein [Rhizobium sp. PDO1-076]|uniref:protein-disulfide reductase DsbD domain-containing protein n=1 Tax=Rhizobium sp. PDO1-076 TaxID=1125979 RepID=UPI00030AE50F|nr:protein-disulfide reductase DsbD domain-containing protein [Rhizobium sp. PDO1-076]
MNRPLVQFTHGLTFGLLLALATMALTIGDTQAASSDWAVNEGGRMRLVLLPADPDGRREGALVIEPNSGWITYWKEPGDVGIPPALTLSPGSTAVIESIGFPVPKVLDNSGMRDVGYDHAVTLPLVIAGLGADTDTLTVNAFIGVCKNICIPFQADLTVALSSGDAAVAEEASMISAARQRLPDAPSDDFAVTHYAMRSDLKQLDLTLRLPVGTTEPQVFVSGPSGHVFLDGEAEILGDGKVQVSVPIGKLPKTYTLTGKRWGILVLAAGRAMETTLAFD